MFIRKAEINDAKQILEITKKAFLDYQQNLGHDSPVTPALKETVLSVKNDISQNNVFIAEENGVILGSIRYAALSRDLAYIFRFGVEPEIKSNGVGSELLAAVINDCLNKGYKAIALHTNSKYFKLARYYYGKEFYVHSTTSDRGYIRALFIKELCGDCAEIDLTPAINH